MQKIRSVDPTVFWPLKNSSPTPTTPAEWASRLIVARTRPNRRQLLNDRIHYLINTLNCLITANFNGTVWWGEKHDMVCYDRPIITTQDGHHTVKSQTPPPHPTPFFILILPKWCKEMAARPRCVAPLGLHFRPSTDSPLPRGRSTSSAAWGRPPNARLNMLTGRNRRGENHAFAIPLLSCCVHSVRLPFLLRPGSKKKWRKWFQLTITLITIAQNKSQAEKSLDGNGYNCLNNRNGYFSLLNYMWLNI